MIRLWRLLTPDCAVSLWKVWASNESKDVGFLSLCFLVKWQFILFLCSVSKNTPVSRVTDPCFPAAARMRERIQQKERGSFCRLLPRHRESFQYYRALSFSIDCWPHSERERKRERKWAWCLSLDTGCVGACELKYQPLPFSTVKEWQPHDHLHTTHATIDALVWQNLRSPVFKSFSKFKARAADPSASVQHRHWETWNEIFAISVYLFLTFSALGCHTFHRVPPFLHRVSLFSSSSVCRVRVSPSVVIVCSSPKKIDPIEETSLGYVSRFAMISLFFASGLVVLYLSDR